MAWVDAVALARGKPGAVQYNDPTLGRRNRWSRTGAVVKLGGMNNDAGRTANTQTLLACKGQERALGKTELLLRY